MATIHFSGKFTFHSPVYNNRQKNPKVPFDESLSKEKIFMLCGCNPAKYLEFSFLNVVVSQVTFNNGEKDSQSDLLISKKIELKGIMPDVCPPAFCSRLFGGEIKIENLLSGRLQKAIQYDGRINMRIVEGAQLRINDDTGGAFFETKLEDLNMPESSSKALKELEGSPLEISYHLNHYIPYNSLVEQEKRLTGDVYGFIRSSFNVDDTTGKKIKNRRLVAHPNLHPNSATGRKFLYNAINQPITRITDIDGYYDLDDENSLIALHYLNFIPFIDRNYATPEVSKYLVQMVDINGDKTKIGEFKGTQTEMKQSGGLVIFPVTKSSIHTDFKIQIDIENVDSTIESLMLESEWDIILLTDRDVTIGSDRIAKIRAKVYHKNIPKRNHEVRLHTQSNNKHSPIVASFVEQSIKTDDQGIVEGTIQAINFKNSKNVFDPIDETHYDVLPFGRSYGNYVYMEIDNNLRKTNPPVEQIEIPVCVLHVVDSQAIPLKEMSFKIHIHPLLLYYIRYYPWLHVVETQNRFIRFLDLENLTSFRQLSSTIIDRLSKDITDPKKMPRSRDFPIGGIEMIRRWKEAGMPE